MCLCACAYIRMETYFTRRNMNNLSFMGDGGNGVRANMHGMFSFLRFASYMGHGRMCIIFWKQIQRH